MIETGWMEQVSLDYACSPSVFATAIRRLQHSPYYHESSFSKLLL